MFNEISREVKLLSLSFAFILFGFGAVQQYLIPFFSDNGLIEVGFYSLILIYLFFMIFGPVSSVFVSKYGSKKCMLFGAIFYFIFIVSMLAKSHALIYLASVLVGIGASFLWTGQNTYIIKASNKEHYGANTGFFSMFMMLGSGIGILVLGFLITKYSYSQSFLLFSIFPIIGFMLLIRLKNIESEKINNRFRLMKKLLQSKTALKLSSLWFAVNFAGGLTLGIIPMQINNLFGVSFIGILLALFYIIPILLSFSLGKLSDKVGRTKAIAISYVLQLAAFSALYFQSKAMLVAGIIIFALNGTITRAITGALVGDVSTKGNLEFLTAFFWTVQNMSVVLALIISKIFVSEISAIYLVSIIVTVVSFLILQPLLKLSVNEIKERISEETK